MSEVVVMQTLYYNPCLTLKKFARLMKKNQPVLTQRSNQSKSLYTMFRLKSFYNKNFLSNGVNINLLNFYFLIKYLIFHVFQVT